MILIAKNKAIGKLKKCITWRPDQDKIFWHFSRILKKIESILSVLFLIISFFENKFTSLSNFTTYTLHVYILFKVNGSQFFKKIFSFLFCYHYGNDLSELLWQCLVSTIFSVQIPIFLLKNPQKFKIIFRGSHRWCRIWHNPSANKRQETHFR